MKKGKQSAAATAHTRKKILAAARGQFAEHGFKGASLRAIAEQAELTHGLIRHHFGNKMSLWCAMIDEYISIVEARHAPLLNSGGDPVSLLKAFATNYMLVSAETPEVSRLIMLDCSEPGPRLDYLVERIMPVHSAITPVFKRVQSGGYLQEHDENSFFIFLMMLGSFPFTLAPFTNKFYRKDITTRAGTKAHIALVLQTLFDKDAAIL